MQISIKHAGLEDLDYLIQNDKHISREMIIKKIENREFFVIRVDGRLAGWLRFGYFWDTIPFLNMIFLEEGYRRQGIGAKAINYWEKAMKERGYKNIMTSTLSSEQAQFFYRRQDYMDVGCLLLESEALEILFMKKL